MKKSPIQDTHDIFAIYQDDIVPATQYAQELLGNVNRQNASRIEINEVQALACGFQLAHAEMNASLEVQNRFTKKELSFWDKSFIAGGDNELMQALKRAEARTRIAGALTGVVSTELRGLQHYGEDTFDLSERRRYGKGLLGLQGLGLSLRLRDLGAKDEVLRLGVAGVAVARGMGGHEVTALPYYLAGMTEEVAGYAIDDSKAVAGNQDGILKSQTAARQMLMRVIADPVTNGADYEPAGIKL